MKSITAEVLSFLQKTSGRHRICPDRDSFAHFPNKNATPQTAQSADLSRSALQPVRTADIRLRATKTGVIENARPPRSAIQPVSSKHPPLFLLCAATSAPDACPRFVVLQRASKKTRCHPDHLRIIRGPISRNAAKARFHPDPPAAPPGSAKAPKARSHPDAHISDKKYIVILVY